MTDVRKLEAAIAYVGKTKRSLAASLGISSQAFYNKTQGLSDFKGGEIEILSKELGLDRSERDAIFFAGNSDE